MEHLQQKAKAFYDVLSKDDWFDEEMNPGLVHAWDELEAVINAQPDLLAALEPFAYLAEALEEGQVLNFRGVYVSAEQAQAAAAAIAKARDTAAE